MFISDNEIDGEALLLLSDEQIKSVVKPIGSQMKLISKKSIEKADDDDAVEVEGVHVATTSSAEMVSLYIIYVQKGNPVICIGLSQRYPLAIGIVLSVFSTSASGGTAYMYHCFILSDLLLHFALHPVIKDLTCCFINYCVCIYVD